MKKKRKALGAALLRYFEQCDANPNAKNIPLPLGAFGFSRLDLKEEAELSRICDLFDDYHYYTKHPQEFEIDTALAEEWRNQLIQLANALDEDGDVSRLLIQTEKTAQTFVEDEDEKISEIYSIRGLMRGLADFVRSPFGLFGKTEKTNPSNRKLGKRLK